MIETVHDIPGNRESSKVASCFVRVKTGFILSLLIAALIGMASCEKVIQLELNKTSPKVVIQASIYDRSGPYYVKISKSVNFEESSTYPPVTGAHVEISDNVGQSEVLSESEAGTYQTTDLRGIPGHTYQLTVKTSDGTFMSKAVMPDPVEMDSIYFSSSPYSGDKVTTVRFTDPPYNINYYRLVYLINKIEQKPFYVLSDELLQGATIRYSLMSRGNDINLLPGDQITVWLESINNEAFEYFRTITTEGGQSASPSNPVSNISNGALGYFNACSVRKISGIVGK